MTTGMVHDQDLEKQMGCMAGFLQLFDRHHMHPGKRIYSTKRLAPSPDVDSSSSSSGKLAAGSPASSTESQQEQLQMHLKSSPECVKSSPSPETKPSAEVSARMCHPLSVFEFKEATRSPSKFREFPRLSLDSRAIVDGKGSLRPREIRTSASFFAANRCESDSADQTTIDENEKQRRSPSVIARLMGLDALPDSGEDPYLKAELRRSASESRSRDLLRYQYMEGKNFHHKQSHQKSCGSNAAKGDAMVEGHRLPVRGPTVIEFSIRKPISEPAKVADEGFPTSSMKSRQQRKSFFDSQDFYPEPKQTRSLYGEIEKRLKMRGIDEPAKDLETLKQILEALQLKGLLHSNKPVRQIGQRNFVFDRKFSSDESPIIAIQPSRYPSSPTRPVRTGNNSLPSSNIKSKPGNHRNLNLHGETSPPVRPRRDRVDTGRNSPAERRTRNPMSPDRNESNARSPSCSLVRRNPRPSSTTETQRRGNDSRSSSAHSPKMRNGSDHTTIRSPRNNRRQTADSETHQRRIPCPAEEESSSISGSSFSTSSQIDTEPRRSKTEEYKEGKSLLERCDQLLHSIAEMTATESQPSPVSVLDSSFYKDDSPPSPVLKRCTIDFKDRSVELDDENWRTETVPIRRKSEEDHESDDSDFLYVSEVLQAMDRISDDSDVFFLLEKHQYKNDSSYVCRLHRKLTFDTVTEILDKKRQLPPWKAVSGAHSATGKPSLREIWSELSRFRDNQAAAEDLFQVICGVLRRDMAGDKLIGWRDCPIETSEVVLDVERSIFKDLIGETIRDLAGAAGKSRLAVPRRKLAF